MRLKDRFALITGGSQGLGAEIARRCNEWRQRVAVHAAQACGQQALTRRYWRARVVTVAGDVGKRRTST